MKKMEKTKSIEVKRITGNVDRNKKKMRGITLIALVITIIVLLILVGVTLSTLSGQDGILNKVAKAVEETEKATEDEQRKMAMFEATMNTENTEFQGITIPAGFSPTRIAGESTVDEGLVITDSEGNEFVWIPVDKATFETKFKRVTGYVNKSLDQETFDRCTEPYSEGTTTEKEEYEAMRESVAHYGGFYIGRYEAGNDGKENVIVQKNVKPYNGIIWGINMTDETYGVLKLARNFKKGKAYENSVTSTLIYGVQWDATMQFFDNNYLTNTCDPSNSYVANSTGKGNFSGQLMNTGSNDEYAVKNIYDMAGNLREWTMETCDNDKRVLRGGNFERTSTICAASMRTCYDPYIHGDLGFRLALYVEQ